MVKCVFIYKYMFIYKVFGFLFVFWLVCLWVPFKIDFKIVVPFLYLSHYKLVRFSFSVWERISAGGSRVLVRMACSWIYFSLRFGKSINLLTFMASYKAHFLEGIECACSFEFLGAPCALVQLVHGWVFVAIIIHVPWPWQAYSCTLKEWRSVNECFSKCF